MMSRIFSAALLSVLLIQPFTPLFAAEFDVLDESVQSEQVPAAPPQEESLPVESESNEDVYVEPSAIEIPIENETNDSVDVQPEISAGVTPAEVPTSTVMDVLDATTSVANDLVEESIPGDSNSDSASTTPVDEEVVSVDDEVPSLDVSSTTDDGVVIDDVIQEVDDTTLAAENTDENADIATTTEQSEVSNEIVATVVHSDETKYVFSKDACIGMGDGTFYCTEIVDAPEVLLTDRVLAAPDADGDKEIFIEHDGEPLQITSNQFDDEAPYFDQVSNTLVWQRLIDGRYQVITYDIDDEIEEQITSEYYNNMEPSRFDTAIAWQGWIGNDWEIMLSVDGEIAMLTDNTIPDIAPKVTGDYVMWQSFEDNAWRVKVYDRRTKLVDTIADAEGASVNNPRFVLVYDTKQENGDIETKGYDLNSKATVPLAATPAPAPKKIPEPEQTGEERALVQPPVQVKQKTETDTPMGDGPDGDEDLLDGASGALIIFPLDTASSSTEIAPEGDVVANEAASSTANSEIADLIITPYVEEILPETE